MFKNVYYILVGSASGTAVLLILVPTINIIIVYSNKHAVIICNNNESIAAAGKDAHDASKRQERISCTHYLSEPNAVTIKIYQTT